MSWFRQLYGQIILGLILGAIYGVIASALGWGELTSRWIAPFGIIFVNLLKLIAVPLILASLTLGVASLSDLRKLSQIGGHTIFIYILTTLVAITLGLAIVNLTKPGHRVPPEMRNRLQATYQQDMATRTEAAEQTKHRTPLQPLIDMVPSNIFAAASANRNMLQVVFVALLFGVGLIQISAQKAGPVIALLEGLNLLVIRLVDLIMLMAPLGVFALIADTITSVATDSPAQALELLGALGYYCLAVVFGLAAHTLITYPLLLKMFTKMPIRTFFSGIAPAQLVGFCTSSSGATLPVTMERCEEKLGIPEEISSFVLPLGATINMDGTALYQSVAAVFIAQALGLGLDFSAQVTIILTALLASIGSAAVPGAGIIMLVIILEAISVPSVGIALILGVDRILDMLRTVANVTGDATVATLVASSQSKLGTPNLSEDSDQIRVSSDASHP